MIRCDKFQLIGRLFDSLSMERFRASFIKYCCPVWWKIDWKKLDFFGNLKNVHFFPCKKKGVCIAAKAPCVILYIRRPYIFNQGTRSSGNRILASNTRNTGLKKTRQIKLKPCIFLHKSLPRYWPARLQKCSYMNDR